MEKQSRGRVWALERTGKDQDTVQSFRGPVGKDKVTGIRKLLPTLWLPSEKWGWLRVREHVGVGLETGAMVGKGTGGCTPSLEFWGGGLTGENGLRIRR